MTKRSNNLDDVSTDVLEASGFGIIVSNNDQACKIANQYSFESGYEKITVKYKGIEIYQVHHIVFAHIPGYSHTAVSALYEGLNSLSSLYHYRYRKLFLMTTAVSCKCVKEGLNGLISIERVHFKSYDDNDINKEDFEFYLPEGAQKMYPATAVSQCGRNSGQKLPKCLQMPVQVLLNLNVEVDALTTAPPKFLTDSKIVVMAVNKKIACNYKLATVRELLFDDKHQQDFVNAVVRFASDIASEENLHNTPMTPPASCKKQRCINPPTKTENELQEVLPHDKQREIIEKFERNILVTSLHPDDMNCFTRCLGLKDIDYEHIAYEHNHKNPKEQIHCIIKEWFEQKGFQANIKKFKEALKALNKRELYDRFVLYCDEVRNP